MIFKIFSISYQEKNKQLSYSWLFFLIDLSIFMIVILIGAGAQSSMVSWQSYDEQNTLTDLTHSNKLMKYFTNVKYGEIFEKSKIHEIKTFHKKYGKYSYDENRFNQKFVMAYQRADIKKLSNIAILSPEKLIPILIESICKIMLKEEDYKEGYRIHKSEKSYLKSFNVVPYNFKNDQFKKEKVRRIKKW